MEKNTDPPGTNYKIRCPRLGHQVPFDYCRHENNGLPCFKSLDCWFVHFRIEDYLRSKLDKDEWKNAFERPKKAKVQSLLEIIEQAKKNQ